MSPENPLEEQVKDLGQEKGVLLACVCKVCAPDLEVTGILKGSTRCDGGDLRDGEVDGHAGNLTFHGIIFFTPS